MHEPRLVIFGGSFDPPHRGHLRCIEMVLARFPSARVMMIPSLLPGAVAGMDKEPSAPFDARLRMCELLVAELSAALAAQVWVSNLEEGLPVPNRTLTTLRALIDQQRAADLALLVGEDQLVQFPRWYEPREILQRADLVVVGRDLSGNDEVRLAASVDAVLADLQLVGQWKDKGLCCEIGEPESAIYVLGDSGAPYSSRELRDPEREFTETWLTPAVLRYIKDNNLYARKSKP